MASSIPIMGDVVSPLPKPLPGPAIDKLDPLPPDHENPIRGQGGYRTHTDGRGDDVSLATGLSLTHLPDLARQEYAQETDINVQLQRFGVGNVAGQRYGEEDYDLDLLSAHQAVDQATRALERLPEHVLEKFGGPLGAMIALNNGELTAEDLKPPKPPEPNTQPPTPPKEGAPAS